MEVAVGYPAGAPASACTSLVPGHGSSVAMETRSPYLLEVDKLTVVPGGEIMGE